MAESGGGGDWFRGADHGVLVGAFCEAHYGKELVTMGAQGVDDAGGYLEFERGGEFNPYSEWKPDTFENLLRTVMDNGERVEELVRAVQNDLHGTEENNAMTTAEAILPDLREYDFPRAYHTRLVAFGTRETDQAAALAASTRVGALAAQDEVQEFLHSLWSLTTTALDRGEHHRDHKPALVQLEQELGHMVMTLRGQSINRF